MDCLRSIWVRHEVVPASTFVLDDEITFLDRVGTVLALDAHIVDRSLGLGRVYIENRIVIQSQVGAF